MNDFMDEATGGEEPETQAPAVGAAVLPAWYPDDVESFEFYSDPDAPRVVDDADIFSDEEEAALEARLAELRGELQKDIVIFTDSTTYGFTHAVYAADFYDFNGYGIGPEREGVCLMICMDPSDRGWWCCCTGPETMGLYTEKIANQIDDLLYEYMVEGDYYEGVADWMENFRRLYVSGSPLTPDWLMPGAEPRSPDPAADRVIDEIGLLNEEEIAALERSAREISERTGADIAVYTTKSTCGRDPQAFAAAYYDFMGYGGENGGVLLLIERASSFYDPEVHVTAYGAAAEKLTKTNEDRLTDRCESTLQSSACYEAASQWLDQTEHMLRTGRAPRSLGSWEFSACLALGLGLVFGGGTLRAAKKTMPVIRSRKSAGEYLVGLPLVENTDDTFLRTDTFRVYDPIKEESSDSGSSSGSSGRSSYSSSYSGSSGASHSGSGRSF